jgi:hypothetical protein
MLHVVAATRSVVQEIEGLSFWEAVTMRVERNGTDAQAHGVLGR